MECDDILRYIDLAEDLEGNVKYEGRSKHDIFIHSSNVDFKFTIVNFLRAMAIPQKVSLFWLESGEQASFVFSRKQ